jgi:hypothetical protein
MRLPAASPCTASRRRSRAGALLARSVAALIALAALPAAAAPELTERREPPTEGARKGRPRVKLERLTFPGISADTTEASYYKNHLRRSLERETRLADWGADEGSVIEYRFRLDTLRIESKGDVLRVYCAATGELPRRKNATSRLEFSGHPSKRRQLVQRVLEIVARGVITRLAQIEYARRNP